MFSPFSAAVLSQFSPKKEILHREFCYHCLCLHCAYCCCLQNFGKQCTHVHIYRGWVVVCCVGFCCFCFVLCFLARIDCHTVSNCVYCFLTLGSDLATACSYFLHDIRNLSDKQTDSGCSQALGWPGRLFIA